MGHQGPLAARHLHAASTLFGQALAMRPSSAWARLRRATMLLHLARLEDPATPLSLATAQLQEARADLMHLSRAAPGSTSVREALARVSGELCHVHLAEGDEGPAGRLALEALECMEEVAAERMDRAAQLHRNEFAPLTPALAEMFLHLAESAGAVAALAPDSEGVDEFAELAEKALDQATNMVGLATTLPNGGGDTTALITRVQLASGRLTVDRVRHLASLGELGTHTPNLQGTLKDLAVLADETRERAGSSAQAAAQAYECTRLLGDTLWLAACLMRASWGASASPTPTRSSFSGASVAGTSAASVVSAGSRGSVSSASGPVGPGGSTPGGNGWSSPVATTTSVPCAAQAQPTPEGYVYSRSRAGSVDSRSRAGSLSRGSDGSLPVLDRSRQSSTTSVGSLDSPPIAEEVIVEEDDVSPSWAAGGGTKPASPRSSTLATVSPRTSTAGGSLSPSARATNVRSASLSANMGSTAGSELLSPTRRATLPEPASTPKTRRRPPPLQLSLPPPVCPLPPVPVPPLSPLNPNHPRRASETRPRLARQFSGTLPAGSAPRRASSGSAHLSPNTPLTHSNHHGHAVHTLNHNHNTTHTTHAHAHAHALPHSPHHNHPHGHGHHSHPHPVSPMERPVSIRTLELARRAIEHLDQAEGRYQQALALLPEAKVRDRAEVLLQLAAVNLFKAAVPRALLQALGLERRGSYLIAAEVYANKALEAVTPRMSAPAERMLGDARLVEIRSGETTPAEAKLTVPTEGRPTERHGEKAKESDARTHLTPTPTQDEKRQSRESATSTGAASSTSATSATSAASTLSATSKSSSSASSLSVPSDPRLSGTSALAASHLFNQPNHTNPGHGAHPSHPSHSANPAPSIPNATSTPSTSLSTRIQPETSLPNRQTGTSGRTSPTPALEYLDLPAPQLAKIHWRTQIVARLALLTLLDAQHAAGKDVGKLMARMKGRVNGVDVARYLALGSGWSAGLGGGAGAAGGESGPFWSKVREAL